MLNTISIYDELIKYHISKAEILYNRMLQEPKEESDGSSYKRIEVIKRLKIHLKACNKLNVNDKRIDQIHVGMRKILVQSNQFSESFS